MKLKSFYKVRESVAIQNKTDDKNDSWYNYAEQNQSEKYAAVEQNKFAFALRSFFLPIF